MTRFDAASAIVLGDEGSWSNDPGDSGGLTVWGHDQASWPDLLSRVPSSVRAQLPSTVATLSKAQALLAYRAGYWDEVGGDYLPAPLALAVFDSAVNQGLSWAPAALQSVLGVSVDGIVGPVTLRAAARADPLLTLAEFTYRRLLHYRGCGNYGEFGHGWETRALRTVALAMTYSDSMPLPFLPHIGDPA